MMMGKSLYEVTTHLSQRELNIWHLYRKKYGPMNPVRKYDQGHSLVASQINRAHGGQAKPIDFIMYGKEAEKQIEVDDNLFIEALINTGRARVVR